jgi:hypothetical protein
MKTIFISFILLSSSLAAQLREDLFEDVNLSTILIPDTTEHWEDFEQSRSSLIYHYIKAQKKQSELNLRELNSLYLFHKGKIEAYSDILNFFDTH